MTFLTSSFEVPVQMTDQSRKSKAPKFTELARGSLRLLGLHRHSLHHIKEIAVRRPARCAFAVLTAHPQTCTGHGHRAELSAS